MWWSPAPTTATSHKGLGDYSTVVTGLSTSTGRLFLPACPASRNPGPPGGGPDAARAPITQRDSGARSQVAKPSPHSPYPSDGARRGPPRRRRRLRHELTIRAAHRCHLRSLNIRGHGCGEEEGQRCEFPRPSLWRAGPGLWATRNSCGRPTTWALVRSCSHDRADEPPAPTARMSSQHTAPPGPVGRSSRARLDDGRCGDALSSGLGTTQPATTSTGMPFRTLVPDSGSIASSSASTLLFTPARSRATRSCVPARS